MSSITCFQVDAFTDKPFRGNPAAICLLDSELNDGLMQSIALEMNLSETAFVRSEGDAYSLRWFTPGYEVDLCGHATLASAHVLWSEKKAVGGEAIQFRTRSGLLTCSQRDDFIEMDFPATRAVETAPPDQLVESLGVVPMFVGASRYDLLVLVDSEAELRRLEPDFRALATVDTRGIMVTARSEDSEYDFVSRFFAPSAGIDEDPVTGSAHCCLGPFWSERLGKQSLRAYQASRRGGDVHIQLNEDRVILSGKAVTILRGNLITP